LILQHYSPVRPVKINNDNLCAIKAARLINGIATYNNMSAAL
jgi:hypothetical protein